LYLSGRILDEIAPFLVDYPSHFEDGSGFPEPASSFGMWLSLVEYLNGVQVVVGSNPAIPTN
jgi:hypothetical protein